MVDTYDALDTAISLQRAGRLVEAEAAYLAILRNSPGEMGALLNLGQVRAVRGDLMGAVEVYRRFLAHIPDFAEAYARIGEIMSRVGGVAGANGAYDKAAHLEPLNAKFRLGLDNARNIERNTRIIGELFQAGKRIDLREITFMIPCRLESEDRKRNLALVVRHILAHFDTNIIISEDDPGGRKVPDLLSKCGIPADTYSYIHISENDSPFTHKSKQVNMMAAAATTRFVAIQDTDVIAPPLQYFLALGDLAGGAALVCPYNGLFFDIHPHFLRTIVERHSLSPPELFDSRNTLLYNNCYGGVAFFDRQVFTRYGGLNENFISWGWEDYEIYRRIDILGLGVRRGWGPLLHLSHARLTNSMRENPWFANNKAEYDRVIAMNREDLLKAIAAGAFTRPLINARDVPSPAAAGAPSP